MSDRVALTNEERDNLCDAMMDYTHTHTNAAPARLDKHVVPAVEKILAARLAGKCPGPHMVPAGPDIDW